MTRLKIASIEYPGRDHPRGSRNCHWSELCRVGRRSKPAPRPPVATITATVIAHGNPPVDAIPEPPAPAQAGPGIEGRIVGLDQGRPIAGGWVEVTNLLVGPGSAAALGRWLAQVKDRGVSHPSDGLSPGGMVAAFRATSRGRSQLSSPSPTNLTTTTGADGGFHLPGIGPEASSRGFASPSPT